MVTLKEKLIITNRLSASCPSHSRTDVTVRDVTTTIDEPVARGGSNMGPSPTETLLAALVGCTNVIGHKCANKHGVEIDAMDIDAEWTFDRRGTQLVEEVELPFPKITLTINLTTQASDADIDKVRQDLNRYCPVAKVIRNAGSEIEEIWNVKRP